MVYLDEVLVKVFLGSSLGELEAGVNSWVSREYVLVKDIKHDHKGDTFVWVVLYQQGVPVNELELEGKNE